MTYIINLIKSIFMMAHSNKIGQNTKDIKKLIKFLSTRESHITIEVIDDESNALVNDIRKYIDRYGSGIGIVREMKFVHMYENKVMKVIKLKLYKKKTRQELLREALNPYINQSTNSKIVNINEYKRDRITLAI